jgi:hypothetical protein
MMRPKKYSIRQSTIKKLAIVLFCFELLAPSIYAMIQTDCSREVNSSFNITIPHTSSLNALLAEQLIEEERDERGNDGLRINSFYQITVLGPIQIQGRGTRHSNRSTFNNAHPLLYKKNCTFRI